MEVMRLGGDVRDGGDTTARRTGDEKEQDET